jgi:hypothetical protein
MLKFETTIKKFGEQGEKTGWTYIEINAAQAQVLKPGNKKSFRVKGKLDDFSFEGVALIPMGKGSFLMALNAATRKQIRKNKGARILVQMMVDTQEPKISPDLIECLKEEGEALNYFNSLAPSHQLYFSRWIESAKTDFTKAKRIAQSLKALLLKWDFGQMLRSLKKDKAEDLPFIN